MNCFLIQVKIKGDTRGELRALRVYPRPLPLLRGVLGQRNQDLLPPRKVLQSRHRAFHPDGHPLERHQYDLRGQSAEDQRTAGRAGAENVHICPADQCNRTGGKSVCIRSK